ncbi:MAG: putative Ig domain-containing protein, partial [Planctomycetes bacterium]|nr:putative Ig domain-containing protein [Planctomycetota bacterium]
MTMRLTRSLKKLSVILYVACAAFASALFAQAAPVIATDYSIVHPLPGRLPTAKENSVYTPYDGATPETRFEARGGAPLLASSGVPGVIPPTYRYPANWAVVAGALPDGLRLEIESWIGYDPVTGSIVGLVISTDPVTGARIPAATTPGVIALPEFAIIEGTPIPGAAGVYTFTVEAFLPFGAPYAGDAPMPAQAEYTIEVEPEFDPPVIVTAALADAQDAEAYAPFTLEVHDGQLPLNNWRADGLPPGMSMSADGVISGIPEVGSSLRSPWMVTISVDDSNTSGARTATTTLPLVVSPTFLRIEAETLTAGYEGLPYAHRFEARGGYEPYTYTAVSGLPSGLSIDANTGVLSGVLGADTAGRSGTQHYRVVVEVADSHPAFPQSIRETFALVVSREHGGTFRMATATLPLATDGEAYAAQLVALGGSQRYSWAVTGDLPAGLSMDRSGRIFGTVDAGASAQSPYVASFTVTDLESGQRVSVRLPLNVLMEGDIAAELRATGETPTQMEESAEYRIPLAAKGGIAPYHWRGISVPAGLNVIAENGEWLLMGTLAPTPAPSVTVQLEVSDSASPVASARQSYTLSIASAEGSQPVILTTSLPAAVVGESYGPVSIDIANSTGTIELTATGLPEGLSLGHNAALTHWYLAGQVEHGVDASIAGTRYPIRITLVDS